MTQSKPDEPLLPSLANANTPIDAIDPIEPIDPAGAPPVPGELGAPDDVAHPKRIKTFVRRAGRTTTGQAKAFETLGPVSYTHLRAHET